MFSKKGELESIPVPSWMLRSNTSRAELIREYGDRMLKRQKRASLVSNLIFSGTLIANAVGGVLGCDDTPSRGTRPSQPNQPTQRADSGAPTDSGVIMTDSGVVVVADSGTSPDSGVSSDSGVSTDAGASNMCPQTPQDPDGDGLLGNQDTCETQKPLACNTCPCPEHPDRDGDRKGDDACDCDRGTTFDPLQRDFDNDGLCDQDPRETCYDHASAPNQDTDGDGVGGQCDCHDGDISIHGANGSRTQAAFDTPCDGIDQNCNGSDAGGNRCQCRIGDIANFGTSTGACEVGEARCVAETNTQGQIIGSGFVVTRQAIGPRAEICDAQMEDENCDGSQNENCTCAAGQRQACGINRGICRPGEQVCGTNGQWGSCTGHVPAEPREDCDPGRDADCDGDPINGFRNVNTQCQGRHGVCATQSGVYECGNLTATSSATAQIRCSEDRGGSRSIAIPGANDLTCTTDDNCNGIPGEGCPRDCVPGQMRVCGTDTGECVAGSQSCNSTGYWNPCSGATAPRLEVCDVAQLDENCNSQSNEGCQCVLGQMRACGSAVGECIQGSQSCDINGQWSACTGGRGPATEVCDATRRDEDCDSQSNEGCACVQGQTQACGSSVGECRPGTQTCDINGVFGACMGAIGPGARELCDAARLDENCNGQSNENCACVTGETRECGSAVGECRPGTQTCDAATGQFAACTGGRVPTTEVCDATRRDEDCDSQSNEGCACVEGQTQACGSAVGQCRQGTQTCDVNGIFGACTGAVGPSNEVCDAARLDENCNGQSNENCACVPGETHACGSAVGECLPGTQTCDAATGQFGACTGGRGPTTEVCDATRRDEDCDSQSNEGCACVEGQTQACGSAVGQCRQGTQTCNVNGIFGACNGAVGPSNEVCDPARNDEDCDSQQNEGCACVQAQTQACGSAIGECRQGTQTCDNNGVFGACVGAIGPQALERCDVALLDENCNGQSNENCACVTGETHACGSAVGECLPGTQTCDSATGQFGACTGGRGPATEVCDATRRDEDCDTQINEGCACVQGQTQACGSAVGQCRQGTQTCDVNGIFGACNGAVGPSNEVCDPARNDEDCDSQQNEGCACVQGETQACGSAVGECRPGTQTCDINGIFGTCMGAIGPGARELCDAARLDENCNGQSNENCACVTGETRACGSAAVGICLPGTQTCDAATGQFGACTGGVNPQPEDADPLVDRDCDGSTTNGFPTIDQVCTGTYGRCATVMGVIEPGVLTATTAAAAQLRCSVDPGGTRSAALPEETSCRIDDNCNDTNADATFPRVDDPMQLLAPGQPCLRTRTATTGRRNIEVYCVASCHGSDHATQCGTPPALADCTTVIR